MNVTQLIKRVRRSAFLADNSVNWTDANIVEELNDVLTQLYAKAVIQADGAHWQLTEYTPLIADQRSYRSPSRSVMGTTMRSQITEVSPVDWWPIEDLSETDALRYEYGYNRNSPLDSMPTRKIVRGENWWLLPPATHSNRYVVRTHFMVRPSRLCLPQASSSAGVITAIDPVTRVLTIAAAFQSVDEAGALASAIGTNTVDVLRVGGWHKVQWTGTATVASGTVTLAADSSGLGEADDLSDIAVGDVVRVADQTDWPALPADYHRSLADATAAKILTALGMADRSQELSQAHVVPDLQRFGDLLRPRDGSSVFVLVAPEFA